MCSYSFFKELVTAVRPFDKLRVVNTKNPAWRELPSAEASKVYSHMYASYCNRFYLWYK